MRKRRLHRVAEYLKTVDFYHDTFDLEDDIEQVLAEYGICDAFTDKELGQLQKDLRPLAERNEFNEALRYAANTETVGGIRMVNILNQSPEI